MSISLNFVGELSGNSNKHLIQKQQYHIYKVKDREYLNTSNHRCDIEISSQNVLFNTADSKIIISGRVTCPGLTAAQALTPEEYLKINFVTNGVLHLFSQISFYICNDLASIVDRPGYAILIKNILTSDKAALLETMSGENMINNEGYFSISIPINQLFPMFETYNKPIVYVSQKLEFLRNLDDADCFYIEDDALKTKLGDNKLSVNLSNIFWKVPHIEPVLSEQIKFNKIVESNKYLTIPYKDWRYEFLPSFNSNSNIYTWNIRTMKKRPLYALFCFSTNKENDFKKDNSTFDFCDLQNIKVYLNTGYYPSEDINLDWSKNEYSNAYDMYRDFKESYIEANPISYWASRLEFRNKYPVFVVDMSYRNEDIKDIAITTSVTFTFKNNAPQNTVVHCILVSESYFAYSPGTNLTKTDK